MCKITHSEQNACGCAWFAHLTPDGSKQTLREHLRGVGELASQFACAFHVPILAHLLGDVHDLGKRSEAFQTYLLKSAGDSEESNECAHIFHMKGPDHSTASGQFLVKQYPCFGKLFAYITMGHHSGLPNGPEDETNATVTRRLQKKIPDWKQECVNVSLYPQEDELVQELSTFLRARDAFSCGFLVRMLFSCLVDADWLDTEAFMNADKTKVRATPYTPLAELLTRVEAHLEARAIQTQKEGREKEPVMCLRRELRTYCQAHAHEEPGLFTLDVPTGGGKTLASLLFALRHACAHNLSRVIVVIPFTTIIEQTAQIYRTILGPENVLEIHHRVDPDAETTKNKLLAENWEAPLIVTTNVQFFESLYSNRPSRCRKLHNIAKSVIILDEVQGLPLGKTKPCLRALKELVTHYGTSVVLSTATQIPFFSEELLKECAFSDARAIFPHERKVFYEQKLRRTQVQWRKEKQTDETLCERMSNEKAVLVVVSSRAHARALFNCAQEQFPARTVYHLSANMCGAHRTQVLHAVRERLRAHEDVILISTQLVEAGVDLDFSCVMREIAGVDSMVQAAGRCNREGCRLEGGRVILFESADLQAVPQGPLRKGSEKGKETLRYCESQKKPLLGEEAIQKYFDLLWHDVQEGVNATGLDEDKILIDCFPHQIEGNDPFGRFKFRTMAEKFHLIEDNMCTVFVPWGEQGRELCEQLRHTFVPSEQRAIARRLQNYSVSMYGFEPRDKNKNLIAEHVHETYWVLTSPEQYYTPACGLQTEALDGLLLV